AGGDQERLYQEDSHYGGDDEREHDHDGRLFDERTQPTLRAGVLGVFGAIPRRLLLGQGFPLRCPGRARGRVERFGWHAQHNTIRTEPDRRRYRSSRRDGLVRGAPAQEVSRFSRILAALPCWLRR